MRISDWSSDVCSSDLQAHLDLGISRQELDDHRQHVHPAQHERRGDHQLAARLGKLTRRGPFGFGDVFEDAFAGGEVIAAGVGEREAACGAVEQACLQVCFEVRQLATDRSEEHTSELQSLMRISYAVFCLKKTRKKNKSTNQNR